MMTEWSASSVQLCCFNADGIVDYERWVALPDGKHIVVLLKETNALSGSLVDFLSHGGSKTYYRTWNNVARWANMILNETYVVSLPHPNRAAKCWTLELEKILRETGRL